MTAYALAAICVCTVYVIVIYLRFSRTPAHPDWPAWTR